MTSLELQALRARLRAASSGPWSVQRIPNSFDSHAGDRFTHPCVRGFRVPRRLYNLAWQQVEADAEFMAHARQDIPTLLEEVEHLKATIEECRVAVTDMRQRRSHLIREDLSRVEEFLVAEQTRWPEGQRRPRVRRLRLSHPVAEADDAIDVPRRLRMIRTPDT